MRRLTTTLITLSLVALLLAACIPLSASAPPASQAQPAAPTGSPQEQTATPSAQTTSATRAPTATSAPVATAATRVPLKDALAGMEPQDVWQNFYDLTQVPRPSHHEEQVRDFLVQFGKGLGLETIVDDVGNVLIRKPASRGMENHQGVVLQAHMDMVPQKTADSTHDFLTDPIDAYVEGDWVAADGTTLGADDGMGMAIAMAVLQSQTPPLGPIEALFTVNEEDGMDGALGLQPGLLQGTILINLDSETEGEFTIGSAGGEYGHIKAAYTEASTPDGMQGYQVTVSGLQGGHSGVNINLGRGHATKLLVRLLSVAAAEFGLRLAGITGGTAANAIPQEATALVAVPTAQADAFLGYVGEFQGIVQAELAATEPDLVVGATPVDVPAKVMAEDAQRTIIDALYGTPQGVLRMSDAVPDLVETSTNMGIVQGTGGELDVTFYPRSSVDSELDDVAQMIASVWDLGGIDVTYDGRYPGWKPNPDSPILALMQSVYHNLYGKDPNVVALHAGLECGVIQSKYPGMDAISIGPTLQDVHTPDERLEIATVQKLADLLTQTLVQIPSATAQPAEAPLATPAATPTPTSGGQSAPASGAGLPNPASQNCIQQGGTLAIEERGDGGQFGVCYFEDNMQCEEWALMRGDCPVGGLKVTGYVTPAARCCAITGGQYAVTGKSGANDEQGTCTFKDGSQCDAWDYYNGTGAASAGAEAASPGGAGLLVFDSTRGGEYRDLWVMSVDGTPPTRLTEGEANNFAGPWSPDGTRVVYTCGGLTTSDICIVNADGTGMLNLTDTPNVDEGFPAWSPDGEKIAFTTRRDGNNEIYEMPAPAPGASAAAASSKWVRLTDNPTDDFAPAWSPDGSQIAFVSDRDRKAGIYDIYIMQADGSGVRRLTADTAIDYSPAWSPDGKMIAFRSHHDGPADIYLIGVDGAGLHDLTNNPADDWAPQWSPDGTLIAFQTNRDGDWEIYTIHPDGSNSVNLTNDPAADDQLPFWRP